MIGRVTGCCFLCLRKKTRKITDILLTLLINYYIFKVLSQLFQYCNEEGSDSCECKCIMDSFYGFLFKTAKVLYLNKQYENVQK